LHLGIGLPLHGRALLPARRLPRASCTDSPQLARARSAPPRWPAAACGPLAHGVGAMWFSPNITLKAPAKGLARKIMVTPLSHNCHWRDIASTEIQLTLAASRDYVAVPIA
jgi:hypothetical protein